MAYLDSTQAPELPRIPLAEPIFMDQMALTDFSFLGHQKTIWAYKSGFLKSDLSL